MIRAALLRRAAAATLGVDRRPDRARSLPPHHDLTLARRAAAATIGVRTRRPPAATAGKEPARNATAGRVERGAPSGPFLVSAGGPPPRTRQRRGLVLAAVAAVVAIAFGAFSAYREDTFVDTAPPAGALPERYIGTWKTAVPGNPDNTRTLVIRQGEVGDTVMSLTADGPEYHCVFRARLEAVVLDGIRLGKSTVARGRPPESCSPGGASTVLVVGENTLRRIAGESTLTYTRAR
ncbi:hypothetical protein AB0C93_13175 [Streptomyces sp. NPDC048518]|uniref:hypothetical protein n=1 Tax=Streptomyces sp. NPDC048518 TaxID=3155029 RepID=UPI0033C4E482